MQSQAMQLLVSKESVEWYTPSYIIEMAREVMGNIDLDPASHPIPQQWIQAKQYYQFDLTGFKPDPSWSTQVLKHRLKHLSLAQMLEQPQWTGRVWLNSPFDSTTAWIRRLIHDYDLGGLEAIALVNSNLGYKWFEDLWNAYPVCCARERIRFVKEDGTVGGEAKRGQTFVYLGPNVDRFAEVFSRIGRIILPGNPISPSATMRRRERMTLDRVIHEVSEDLARNALVM